MSKNNQRPESSRAHTASISVPALYEPYVNASTSAVDEWTLSENMRSDTANGGISQLENHYKTFIVSSLKIDLGALLSNCARRPKKILHKLRVLVSTLSAFLFLTGRSKLVITSLSWRKPLGRKLLFCSWQVDWKTVF